MELSVREVATLIGCSPRAIRAQLARGELAGAKRGGRWYVDRRNLPLTEAQRRALQAKADSIRQAVDQVLPPRLARTSGQRSRSLADLEAFRAGAALLAEVRASDAACWVGDEQQRLVELLEEALFLIAEGAQQYERELKLEALNRARGNLARVVAMLLLRTELAPDEPVASWIAVLESQLIPAVSGLARWADGLRRERR